VVTVAAADVPADGALVLPRQRCAVVRNGDAILALDLTCPHLGCTVKATPQGFACPCHGSRFKSSGEVIEGPATRAMTRLGVEERGGVLSISREEG
jgi:Rieske Fe-S protein